MSKDNNKKWSAGINMWAVKPVRTSVTLEPWGMYAAGENENKNEPRGGRPVGCKARTGSITGGPLGSGAIKQKDKGSNGNVLWAGELARGR